MPPNPLPSVASSLETASSIPNMPPSPSSTAGTSMAEVILRQLDRLTAQISQALPRLQLAHDAAGDAAARSQIVADIEALFDLDLALSAEKIAIRKRLMRGETAGLDLHPALRLKTSIEERLIAMVLRGIEIDLHGAPAPVVPPAPASVAPAPAMPAPGAAPAPTPDAGPAPTPAPPAAVLQTVGPLKGAQILEIAKRHLGQRYENINIDYTEPNWRGSFDCAEYASYCVWRAYGMLYGARLMSGTEPQGKNVEAYTGFWQEDANTKGMIVSEAEALRTPGAFILRYPPGPGTMGHIGICVGDGDAIYEAHSTNRGVIKGSAADRRWNVGVLVPGVDYGSGPISSNRLLIYRELVPLGPRDEIVAMIQQALVTQSLLAPKDVTGIFDRTTTQAVSSFQRQRGLLVDGEVGPDTGTALGLGKVWGRTDAGQLGPPAPPMPPTPTPGPPAGVVNGRFNEKHNVTFGTHVPGGFFSADPDDMSVRRAIRTNNPGALNISKWQTEFPGFVGRTQPDSKGNVTTIYRTPEHGVAAWYHLIADRYGIADNGSFTIGQLAAKYSGTGSANSDFAKQYIRAWSRLAGNAYDASSVVTLTDKQSLLQLAHAMFANETGFATPLSDAQILHGINAWRTKTLA